MLGDAATHVRCRLQTLAVFLPILAAACDGGDGAPPPPSSAPPHGATSDSAYAGTAACRACHVEASLAWDRSPHATTSGILAKPEGGADGAVGSRWMQAYHRADARGLHAILPNAFDLRARTWRDVHRVLDEIAGVWSGAAPSYVVPSELPIFETDCAGCHASRARHRLDVVTGRMDSRWADAAIDCEACHGPGAAHARSWETLSTPSPMLRLENLPSRAKTAVCARCHGGPPSESDATPEDWARLVTSLADRRGFFPDGRAAGQIYQQPAFVQSPCHRQGGLACTDCHEAHGPGLKGGGDLDSLCVGCHEGKASRAHTFHAPSGAGARCLECHMPRVLSGLTAHQRDHRIGVPLPAVEDTPDACTACHKDHDKAWAAAAWRERWGEPPRATLDAVRGVRLARDDDPAAIPLLTAALAHGDPFFRANAVRVLADATAGIDDPAPEVRLAALEKAARAPDAKTRLPHFLADAEPLLRAKAAVGLAMLGVAPDDARLADVELAVRLTRGWAEGNLFVGVKRLRTHDTAGAADAFLAAVTYEPSLDRAFIGLAEALDATGRVAEASATRVMRARTLAFALEKRPGDPELAEAAADASVAAGEPDAARRLLSSALRASSGAARDRIARRLEALDAPTPPHK